jgi:hypothetical protein
LQANGDAFPEADSALSRLYRAYEQVQPRADPQKTLLATSFTNLDKISQARTDTGPPGALWAVIFMTSGLLLGCAIVYGVKKPTLHYTMVATVGVLVAANLFLVLELSFPFVGKIATSPEPLRDVIRFLSTPFLISEQG